MTKNAELSLLNARWSEIVKDGVVLDTWNWVFTRVLIGKTNDRPETICCEKVL
jgi:hypothetical protein